MPRQIFKKIFALQMLMSVNPILVVMVAAAMVSTPIHVHVVLDLLDLTVNHVSI